MDDLAEGLRNLARQSNDGYLRGPALEAANQLEARNATIEALQEKVRGLTIALHDAINRPKGVVPASAEQFYDANLAQLRSHDHG